MQEPIAFLTQTAILLAVSSLPLRSGNGALAAEASRPPAPPVVLQASLPNKSVVRMPDGRLRILFMAGGRHCRSITSSDGGRTWSEATDEFEFPEGRAGIPLTFVDRDGALHAFIVARRGEGRRPTIDYFLDIWHTRQPQGQRQWSRPRRIFDGYVGALNGVTQLASGRIVLAQQFWVPGLKSAPPTGSHVVTSNYSDDGGDRWQVSPARLTAPCYADYIGSDYGACEPVVLELKDGRAWMLMRTQTGFLYESFSRDGANWSPATPTRFGSSNSPANLLRLPDGRIVLFWNHCENPSRVDGAPVYTNRDVLHAAISDDEGRTWHGYREVFRDPHRNESPPKDGDRGTAYPFSTATEDGQIVLATGQGSGRTALVRIDPDWLYETHHEDDFSAGLESWSVFKPFGPAAGYWRDRTLGAHLVDHPSKPGSNVLHVRRPDEKPGDAAVWNFPMGRRGKLELRILLQKGFGGAEIALADRFITPGDPVADEIALFDLTIGADGRSPGGPNLEHGRWHALELAWDVQKEECRVTLDGKPAAVLRQRNTNSSGVSYLRLHSTAEMRDPAGFLVECVRADVAQ